MSIHISVYLSIYLCIHLLIYPSIHVYICLLKFRLNKTLGTVADRSDLSCKHIQLHVYICIHVYVCIYTCIYIYIGIYIYTHIVNPRLHYAISQLLFYIRCNSSKSSSRYAYVEELQQFLYINSSRLYTHIYII